MNFKIDENLFRKIEYTYNNILFVLLAIVQGIISYGWYHQWSWFNNLTFAQSFFILYSYGIFGLCQLITCLIIIPKFFKDID